MEMMTASTPRRAFSGGGAWSRIPVQASGPVQISRDLGRCPVGVFMSVQRNGRSFVCGYQWLPGGIRVQACTFRPSRWLTILCHGERLSGADLMLAARRLLAWPRRRDLIWPWPLPRMPDDQQRDQDRDDNDEVHPGGHLGWLTDQGEVPPAT